jgi:hypothetical protein
MVYFKDKPNGEFYNLKDWSKNSPNAENQNDLQNKVNNQSKPDERLRTFTWNADLAEYNTDTEDLILKKNVSIITDDKDSIKTDQLSWNNFEQKAKSNTRTTIVGNKGYPIVKSDNIEGDV